MNTSQRIKEPLYPTKIFLKYPNAGMGRFPGSTILKKAEAEPTE